MKMGGRASPFGVDAARVPALVRRLIAAGADWRGFHIFAGSQSLDTAAIIETQAATVALAARLADEAGVDAAAGQSRRRVRHPLFRRAICRSTSMRSARRWATRWRHGQRYSRDRAFAIELGRWLVGECGVYLTRVIDRKNSRGETFLVVRWRAASSARRIGQFRHGRAAQLSGRGGARGCGVPSRPKPSPSSGPLCTPLDRLADRVALPRAESGDVIAVFLAGAYGASASPAAFLGHGPRGGDRRGFQSTPNAYLYLCPTHSDREWRVDCVRGTPAAQCAGRRVLQ